jgi:hypothetical protein
VNAPTAYPAEVVDSKEYRGSVATAASSVLNGGSLHISRDQDATRGAKENRVDRNISEIILVKHMYG